jgi:two-component system alkaline phosphatase synthesis response regulator PhoP
VFLCDNKEVAQKKVFVIDDDEAIVEALTLCLSDGGYVVEAMQKPIHIVDRIAVFTPDVILLDLFLAGEDGRHIAKALKQDERTAAIPVIMFSAHPAGRAEAEELGVAGFLAKPFALDELFRVLRTHVPQ